MASSPPVNACCPYALAHHRLAALPAAACPPAPFAYRKKGARLRDRPLLCLCNTWLAAGERHVGHEQLAGALLVQALAGPNLELGQALVQEHALP